MSYNNQFVSFGFNLIDDDCFMKKYKNAVPLIITMRRYIVRQKFKGDLGLHEYWKKGYLACSKSYRQLANRTELSKTSVAKWIKMLEKDGALVIEKVKIRSDRIQNVYVLGTHNGAPKPEYREYYFLEERFNKINKIPVIRYEPGSLGDPGRGSLNGTGRGSLGDPYNNKFK